MKHAKQEPFHEQNVSIFSAINLIFNNNDLTLVKVFVYKMTIL